MNCMENITFHPYSVTDIAELTEIMKRSFDEDTKIHLGIESGGPKGYDNGELLTKYGLKEQSTQYKILLNDRVIGGMILWINNENHHNYLDTFFVDTNLQNRGIGSEIWRKNRRDVSRDGCLAHRNSHLFSQKS